MSSNPRVSKEDYTKIIRSVRHLNIEQRTRLLLLEKLGGRCVRCRNEDHRVLQLDHIKNNGSEERKKFKGPRILYKNILRGTVPREDYQLLCANCNWIKRYEES